MEEVEKKCGGREEQRKVEWLRPARSEEMRPLARAAFGWRPRFRQQRKIESRAKQKGRAERLRRWLLGHHRHGQAEEKEQ